MPKNTTPDKLLQEREQAELKWLESFVANESERKRYFELDRKCRELGLLPPVKRSP